MLEITVNDKEILLEHSLLSLSLWEQEYEKPFFIPQGSKEERTQPEMVRYFELMCVNREDRHLVRLVDPSELTRIVEYIHRGRTATVVRDIGKSSGSREHVTSELIYYWLVAFRIPFEVETWHLNRLLTLVRVCAAKQEKPKKMTPKERMSRAQSMREINEQRLAAKKSGG